jgi:hypothetical protein
MNLKMKILLYIIIISFSLVHSGLAEAKFSNEPKNIQPINNWIPIRASNGEIIGIRDVRITFGDNIPPIMGVEINRTSTHGALLWQGLYNTNFSEEFLWVDTMFNPNGDIILIGTSENGGIAFKLDRAGNMIWSMQIGNGGGTLLNNESGYWFINENNIPLDGGYLIENDGHNMFAVGQNSAGARGGAPSITSPSITPFSKVQTSTSIPIGLISIIGALSLVFYFSIFKK